jgi:hypothetical protein
MTFKADFFISHASADKQDYILPLASRLSDRHVTYWLDSNELQWGDPLALKINDGFHESRHVVLCLSKNFISSSWTEEELNAAFVRNIEEDGRKVLPLILNSKRQILSKYPLLAGRLCKEYSSPDIIADELAHIANIQAMPNNHIRVVIESVHSGLLSDVYVPLSATVEWLATKAKQRVGLKESLDTGGYQSFAIRWVLVDVNAKDCWKQLDSSNRQKTHALIQANNGIQIVTNKRLRLSEIGIDKDMKFHLCAVEDTDANTDGGVYYCYYRGFWRSLLHSARKLFR